MTVDPRPPAERFWEKVDKSGGDDSCWLWTAATYRGKWGYGVFYDGEKLMPAHRWAWESVNGPIPTGIKILHHCDNVLCVNYLKCLFMGSLKDNTQDMIQKGRHRRALNDDQLTYIKSMKGKESSYVVARRIDRSPSIVQSVWNGNSIYK